MPLYRVTWNGQDILDYTDERMVLLSPHLEMEVNTAGSLRFVVPPYHTYYNLFTEETMLISDVEVYEDDELIWFGRPLELHIDFFKQKEIYCEGGLAFFNDSIQEQSKYDNVNIVSFFKSVIDNHNYQVDSNRQFIVGNVTIDDKNVYREPKYEKTLNVLRGQCLDTNDGYFFVRKENGLCYIDWLKDMPFSCNQTIEFAENLLNVSTSFDGHDYATCVMPLGADDGTGYPINVSDVNDGDILVISEMAKVYGKIVTVLQFNDIEEKTELLEEGRKALERIQYNSRLIECSAADLHSRDGSKEIFKVGQMVHCYSQPHELEMDLPLSKMDLNLDTAAKNITLGIIKKKTLTRITKAKEAEAYSADSYTPGSYNPDSSVVEDLNGDEWEIVLPEESGDPITAIRMPIKITIARDPNKTTYEPGETIDFTGLVVNIWTKNKDDEEIIWTNPPRYLDGTAPMSELSFSTKTAPKVSEFSVQVIWKYKGKSYSALLKLKTEHAKYDGKILALTPIRHDYEFRNWSWTTKHSRFYICLNSPTPYLGWQITRQEEGTFEDEIHTICLVQYNGNIYNAMDESIPSKIHPSVTAFAPRSPDVPDEKSNVWNTAAYKVVFSSSATFFTSTFNPFGFPEQIPWLFDRVPEVPFNPINMTVQEVYNLLNSEQT